SSRTLLEGGFFDLRLRTADILNPDAIDRALEDTDGTADGFLTHGFHRLFGDIDGDGDVDNMDFFTFRGAFGKRLGDLGYLAFLDYDGDGVINGLDMAECAMRPRTRLGQCPAFHT